jgi:hypothetical protein
VADVGPVHVRMYGRVDVLVGGQRCLLPAGRAIELLVLLAAWPGTVVLDAALAGRLSDVPSSAVDNEVHRLVTALRRSVTEVDATVGDLWINNVHGGYQVNPEFVTSDLGEARALLDADPMDTSVAWWSEPLIGLQPEPFIHVFAQLEDTALALASRALTDFRASLGRLEIEQLLELLARHPHEEQLWSQLVDVAVASGDPGTVTDIRMELQVLYDGMGQPIPPDLAERLDRAGAT